MKNLLALILISLLFIFALPITSVDKSSPITITVLYDNYDFRAGLIPDWGFSCLIRSTEKAILFDTGAKSEIFLHNIQLLKINPKEVKIIVLSHIHADHTGGLFSFFSENHNVTVYVPASFPAYFVDKIQRTEANVVLVTKSTGICKNVFILGEMGEQIKEQALVVSTKKGLVVLTGCAHPGIVEMVKEAKKIVSQNIYLVSGGFHLGEKSEAEIKEIIGQFQALEVMKVGASHCTGDVAIGLFEQAYGKNFIPLGVGKVITISR
ncbi:MBL fold metallo-hydrolase [Candidatus Bathyarchaeota archaeon]|nr:MBL fold metallo-hydrolase [Candidatus Bathyarchaeota archaeon]